MGQVDTVTQEEVISGDSAIEAWECLTGGTERVKCLQVHRIDTMNRTTTESVGSRFCSVGEVDRWYNDSIDGIARGAATILAECGREYLYTRTAFGSLIQSLAAVREESYIALCGIPPAEPPIGLSEAVGKYLRLA